MCSMIKEIDEAIEKNTSIQCTGHADIFPERRNGFVVKPTQGIRQQELVSKHLNTAFDDFETSVVQFS